MDDRLSATISTLIYPLMVRAVEALERIAQAQEAMAYAEEGEEPEQQDMGHKGFDG